MGWWVLTVTGVLETERQYCYEVFRGPMCGVCLYGRNPNSGDPVSRLIQSKLIHDRHECGFVGLVRCLTEVV